MRIPKRIKVGGHVYLVTTGHRFREDASLVGQSRHEEGIILVSTHSATGATRERSQVEETFIHELLHAVDSIYNARGLNEDTVMRLSEGLYQVLADNQLLR